MISPREPEVYRQLLDRAYRHFLEQRPMSDYAVNLLMNTILLNLLEEPVQLDTRKSIEGLTDSIINRHGKGITVETMAASMGLSVKQFTRHFIRANNTTPHQFLIKARINHAMYLLEETGLSVNAIADELDYADAFTFSRQFKKVTGKSPTTFRG